MNILFSLIPKEKVAYITKDSTLRQAMEKMEFHRYTAVPVIDNEGKYCGILREGDILWYFKSLETFDLLEAEKIHIKDIPRLRDNIAVDINTTMEEIVDLSVNQNFIPVIDDSKSFIGIVTRKAVIMYLVKKGEVK